MTKISHIIGKRNNLKNNIFALQVKHKIFFKESIGYIFLKIYLEYIHKWLRFLIALIRKTLLFECTYIFGPLISTW